MKEILERNGFEYHGYCKVCGGQAELYKKGNIQCKVKSRKMRFELIINGNKIVGNAKDLEASLEQYLPKEN